MMKLLVTGPPSGSFSSVSISASSSQVLNLKNLWFVSLFDNTSPMKLTVLSNSPVMSCLYFTNIILLICMIYVRNHPQQVFDILSCIYIVFWSQILNMAELVLEEFNELLKEKLTLVVVVDIFEMCFIILFPVVCSVIGLVEVLD